MVQDQTFWLWDFLGRLHPLAVHFPVSLLLFAAFLELFSLKKYQSGFRTGIEALVAAGAVSAVIAAVFGWLLYLHGDYKGITLDLHQWIGIATAMLSTVTLYFMLKSRKTRKTGMVRTYRVLLFTTAAGVTVAGHFGANLTHGSDFLTSTLPWSPDYNAAGKSNFSLASFKTESGKLTKEQEKELNVEVRAILAHNCYKCHGPEKVKGDLRLDGRHLAMKGGENGPVIVPGKPDESELYRRISLPEGHKDLMPAKDKRLSEKDIATVRFWLEKGAPWPDDDSKQTVFRVARLEPRNPPLPVVVNGMSNPIDRWTAQYFKQNHLNWPAAVSDGVYLRRIYLDILGLLPAAEEIEKFTKDPRSDKRALWVRQLLNRNDDYAQHWLTFWNDALRNDYTGTGYITGGRSNITGWLYSSLKNNKPYNQFVSELISPGPESKGFVEGIKWRGVVNASQRTEMQAAQNVSQVFLGLNLKCASCHNSFISDLKLEDAYAFANIFADTTLEINRCDKPTGKFVDARMLWKQLGTIDSKAPSSVKRRQLADNLVKPEDGRLYRTLVNRIWAQLMGRGLVEPVDVMDNAPWNQDLLDWMAFNFVQNRSDIKELIYLITTSKTYQLPSVGFKEPAQISDPKYKFSGMTRKRMSAEQFSDAVSSLIAPLFADSNRRFDPFAGAPPGMHPSYIRASLVANNSFLTALGRPNRETVVTSRESQANLLQALELTNGNTFNAVLKQGAEKWHAEFRDPGMLVNELYKRALGRIPNDKELKVARQSLGTAPGTGEIQDLFWAIVLLPEFQIIY